MIPGSKNDTKQRWAELVERVRQIESPEPAAVGVDDGRAAVGFGAIHEWFDQGSTFPGRPVCVLSHLAGRALAEDGGYVVWVGRRCWPYGRLLVHGDDRLLLERSVFVDVPNDAAKLWAVDVALRCEAVSAVVADGSGFDIAATRRLQLAARAGRSMGLLARPPGERHELSAAATRWAIQPVVNHDRPRPRWRVTQLRCKSGVGLRLAACGLTDPHDSVAHHSSLIAHHLEYDGVQGLIHLPAELGDRSANPTRPQTQRQSA